MSAMSVERRCPSCGALASADADWCGQCYASLEGPRAPSQTKTTPLRSDGEPAWPCPVCGNLNPIAMNLCVSCGTPFARLFQEAERLPQIDPKTAALWSLLFPGLGQWKCGRSLDAVARMVAFLVPFGTMLLLVVSRLGRGGLGSTALLFSLFLVASLVAWSTSAIDAHRVASGLDPLIGPRTLLWGLVGLILVAVALATAVALPAVRSR
jgi:double zinc ribbon protein